MIVVSVIGALDWRWFGLILQAMSSGALWMFMGLWLRSIMDAGRR